MYVYKNLQVNKTYFKFFMMRRICANAWVLFNLKASVCSKYFLQRTIGLGIENEFLIETNSLKAFLIHSVLLYYIWEPLY